MASFKDSNGKQRELKFSLASASKLKAEFAFDCGLIAVAKDPIRAIAEQSVDIFRIAGMAFLLSGESDYEAFAESLADGEALERLEVAFYETILAFFFKSQTPMMLAAIQKQKQAIQNTSQMAAEQLEKTTVEQWTNAMLKVSGSGHTVPVATVE